MSFFENFLVQLYVKTVLDCACGQVVILFYLTLLVVTCMGQICQNLCLLRLIKICPRRISDISLKKADFRNLSEHYTSHFDAVVCLSNAINEPLEDSETLKAMRSMKAILRDGGILVFDQAQTDATMKKPHRFDPIANERDYSRLFVVDYFENKMEVHIFDFIHTESERDFKHNSFYVRIRLKDSWESILREAEFKKVEYFGDWRFSPYDKEQSRRLIAVAHK